MHFLDRAIDKCAVNCWKMQLVADKSSSGSGCSNPPFSASNSLDSEAEKALLREFLFDCANTCSSYLQNVNRASEPGLGFFP